MKYIRTKDNRIFELDENKSCVKQFNGQDYYFIYKENSYRYENGIDISRQADTIEELCDEFVGIDKTCKDGHQLLRFIPYKCANYWNGGVYGAIWTNKGLIYVAKMVDGKLVLI